MKTTLRISILLNVFLLGGLLFLWTHPPREAATWPPAGSNIEAPVAAVTSSAAPMVRTEVEFKPFHWSQLLSKNNYRDFVANLRAAGCPEPTVGDIVRGDAERAFYVKRAELNVDGSDPGPWSARAQIQLVAYLLGQSPTATQEVAADTAPTSPAALRRRPPPVQVVSSPIAMQSIDPAALAALNLSDDQKQLITDVERTLLMRNTDPVALNPNDGQKQMGADASQSSPNQAGGTMQNPQDPASLARSQQEAQMEADATLEASLGSEAYLGYKLAEEQTALKNQLMSHPNWVLVDPQW